MSCRGSGITMLEAACKVCASRKKAQDGLGLRVFRALKAYART